MRSRLMVLVASIGAFGAACGDNDGGNPDARPQIDALPEPDGATDIDAPPEEADAPPGVMIDAPPPPDAVLLTDAPPTDLCPNGNAAECNGTSGGICNVNGEFATCIEYDVTNHCFLVMEGTCPSHQSCPTVGARGTQTELCTCDASRCGGETGNVCISDDEFVTCDDDTSDPSETCFFEVGVPTLCTPPRSCGLDGADENCICPAVDTATPAENEGCVNTGDLACGVDVAQGSAVLVCTVEPTGCRIWKVQLGCSGLGLTCNGATTACECPANGGSAIYANPLPEAHAGFTGGGACQVENANCDPHPTGARTPSYCSFTTLTEALDVAGNTGAVVASRLVTTGGSTSESSSPAVFDTETFPLNGGDGPALILTTDDDPAFNPNGAGLTVANSTRYRILYNDSGAPSAVNLGAADAVRGYQIINSGVSGNAAIACSGAGPGVRADSVTITGQSGANQLDFGVFGDAGCTGNFQFMRIDGTNTGIHADDPIGISNVMAVGNDVGVNVATATMSNSQINTSGQFGIIVRVALTAGGITVGGVAPGASNAGVLTGADGRGTINWTGGQVQNCPIGFLALGDSGDINVSGTLIAGNGQGVVANADSNVVLNGVTVSGSTSNGINFPSPNTGGLTVGGGTTIGPSGGSGIVLAGASAGTISNATVTTSTGAGVTVADTASLTLGTASSVTLSGTSGVVVTGTGSVQAGAGSTITTNTLHGISAAGGSVTLSSASITGNTGNGVELSGTATLTSTGATITGNADGVHTAAGASGDVGLDGDSLSGNNGSGVSFDGDNTGTVDGVIANGNGGDGLRVGTGTSADLVVTSSQFDNNEGSGVNAISGTVAVSGGASEINTNTTAGVAVGADGQVTVTGAAIDTITINGTSNGPGISNAGRLDVYYADISNNHTHGVLVTTEADSGFTNNGVNYNTRLRNVTITGNTLHGVAVLKTEAAGAPNAATNFRFGLLTDHVPGTQSFVQNNGGNGVVLGGDTVLCVPPALCNGRVRATVSDSDISSNTQGIRVQNGGATGANTQVQIVANNIYSNKKEGLSVGRSLFVSEPGSTRTLNNNRIHLNVAEPGAPAPINREAEILFDGESHLFSNTFAFPLASQCLAGVPNSIFGFICPGREHPAVRVVRKAQVTLTENTWARTPVPNTDVLTDGDSDSQITYLPTCNPAIGLDCDVP